MKNGPSYRRMKDYYVSDDMQSIMVDDHNSTPRRPATEREYDSVRRSLRAPDLWNTPAVLWRDRAIIGLAAIAVFIAIALMFWAAASGDVLPGRLKF